jgi:PhnB protein
MKLSAYLHFNGQCEEAFKFYERALGGKIVSMFTYDGTPLAEQVPAEWRRKIMHAQMSAGGLTLMGADSSSPAQYKKPQGISITIETDQTAEAERLFQALAENGEVQMPIQQTFWATRFGMLVDRFGIPWMVNCSEAVSASSGR